MTRTVSKTAGVLRDWSQQPAGISDGSEGETALLVRVSAIRGRAHRAILFIAFDPFKSLVDEVVSMPSHKRALFTSPHIHQPMLRLFTTLSPGR